LAFVALALVEADFERVFHCTQRDIP
jgi:hypothetical protein